MALAIQFCVGYLALSIRAFANVVSTDVPPMSDQVAKIVDEWVYVISNGMRNAV